MSTFWQTISMQNWPDWLVAVRNLAIIGGAVVAGFIAERRRS